jgi:hypothetical protein
VEVWQEGACVERHERCFGRQQKVLKLEHYLFVLAKKPGALVDRRRWSNGARGAAGRT